MMDKFDKSENMSPAKTKISQDAIRWNQKRDLKSDMSKVEVNGEIQESQCENDEDEDQVKQAATAMDRHTPIKIKLDGDNEKTKQLAKTMNGSFSPVISQ